MSIGNNVKGAVYGAALALVLGQAGPQIGLPEEVITMPIGAVVGFIIGAKAIESKLK